MNEAKDPKNLNQHAPGAKLDGGKPDLSLLVMFGKALSEIGHVGTHGAVKYSRGGWQYVEDGENRYTAAMLRHLFLENEGPMDADSGMYHAAQAAWNALARLELMLRRIENERNSTVSPCTPGSVVKVSEVHPVTYGSGVSSGPTPDRSARGIG